MLSKRTIGGAGVLAVLVAGTALFGHPDDPKERDRLPRYEGPSWRRDVNGLNPNGGGFASENVELMSWITLPEFGSAAGNDCWGYVSPTGREYAIMGLYEGTAWVEITNPGNAQVVAFQPGPSSTWRDIKTYQHYAYAVSEGGSGIQVFDMTNIDNGVVALVTQGTGATHNVALDPVSGFLYRCGGGSNGLRIYSLANPANPVQVGNYSDRYVHDAQIVTYTSGPYAGRQIAFCCGGFNGGWDQTGLTIIDVTNKSNLQVLTHYQYPSGQYSHQGWLTEDRQYFLLDDELDEQNLGVPTRTHVIDVSDLSNPLQVATFTTGSSSIDHNQYVHGDLTFQANYRSGLRVFDVSDPLSPTPFAYFDTFPDNDSANFNGLWSCYPYFPSGTVIGSDIERGLFVWRVEEPLLDITYPNGQPDMISPSGGTTMLVDVADHAGTHEAGTGMLHVDISGDVVDVPMNVVDNDTYQAVFPSAPCGETVAWWVSVETTQGEIYFDPSNAPIGAYTALIADGLDILFEDDFEANLGWTVQNTDLQDGAWERAIPAQGGARGDPPADFDGSGRCYVTGNASQADIDGGPTRLLSPVFDLSADPGAQVSFARWMSNDDGDDQFVTEISNNGGSSWVTIDSVNNTGGWQVLAFAPSDFVSPTNNMRMRFSVADNPNDSVTEAALDAFQISTVVCDGGGGTDLTAIQIETGAILGGDVNDLRGSDDAYVHARSGFGATFIDLHNMTMWVFADTSVGAPGTIDVTVEERIDEPSGIGALALWDWNTSSFDTIGQFSLGSTDQVHTVQGVAAADYVDGAGAILLQVKHIVFVPFLAFTFESWMDEVRIDVN